MSVRIVIDISDIDDFSNKMANIPTKLFDEVHEAMTAGANLIRADAMFYSPVKTGFMRSTIYAKVTGILRFTIGAWAHYARYQEYGTRYFRGRRFIGQAIKERWPHVRDLIRQALKFAVHGR